MGYQLIDGKQISEDIKNEVRHKGEELRAKGIVPSLAVVLVGDDPASAVYVKNKRKTCGEVGVESYSYELPANTTEQQLLELIDELNKDSKIKGILVQLPLPKHIHEEKILLAVDPGKDVDCFHPYNVGLLHIGKPRFRPCTPAGIIELLKRSGVIIQGKECVVIGRSNIVGKPAAALLLAEHGTVTICHSRTQNLREICSHADILVAAVGQPKFVTADMVKDGAVVIDVGVHRTGEGNKLCGDVDFTNVRKKSSFITKVPGGVGPMTIAMLMDNCIAACME